MTRVCAIAGSGKLTEAQVLAIYGSTAPTNALAAEYGVDRWTVSLIRLNKSWSRLTAPHNTEATK